MAVAPTVELAKRNSKQRIDPLIEESEVLRERVKERRSRDSGNTVLSKEFPGGVLILTGANSAVGLRSMPARYLFLDEVDGYPGDVEGEGDPILLAERRSATFQRRKILLVSTPKTKSLSRIQREFEASDQRRYFVPCPHCRERQTLELENLRWPEGRPREAEYACAHCGALIGERHKTWMLEHGEWRPTVPGDGRTAGFHLSSLYSPVGWFSWADAAEIYEQAQKTPDLMKGFVNTVLGLPFEEEAEAPEWQRLYERRESYRIGVVPERGLFLTAGVDVQKDRIEIEVVVWGRGKETDTAPLQRGDEPGRHDPSSHARSPNRPACPRTRCRLGAEVARQAALEPSRSTCLPVRVATSAGNETTSACATCGRRGRNRSRKTSARERAGLEFVRAGFEFVRAYRSYSDRRHMAPSSAGMPDVVGPIIARNVLQGNAQRSFQARPAGLTTRAR
jgi:hypothetical protein